MQLFYRRHTECMKLDPRNVETLDDQYQGSEWMCGHDGYKSWNPNAKVTTVSIERLAHFQCADCQKWWSIGDAPLDRNYYCPWCGGLNSVKAKNVESG